MSEDRSRWTFQPLKVLLTLNGPQRGAAARRDPQGAVDPDARAPVARAPSIGAAARPGGRRARDGTTAPHRFAPAAEPPGWARAPGRAPPVPLGQALVRDEAPAAAEGGVEVLGEVRYRRAGDARRASSPPQRGVSRHVAAVPGGCCGSPTRTRRRLPVQVLALRRRREARTSVGDRRTPVPGRELDRQWPEGLEAIGGGVPPTQSARAPQRGRRVVQRARDSRHAGSGSSSYRR